MGALRHRCPQERGAQWLGLRCQPLVLDFKSQTVLSLHADGPLRAVTLSKKKGGPDISDSAVGSASQL